MVAKIMVKLLWGRNNFFYAARFGPELAADSDFAYLKFALLSDAYRGELDLKIDT